MATHYKLLFAFITLTHFNLFAQNNPFITTWQVDSNDQITIPLQSETYDFDFKWTLTSNTAVQITGNHTNSDGDFTTMFGDAGIYELEINGQFPHLAGYPKVKLLDVLQWGDIQWSNMQNMFQNWPGAGFTANDAPDLSLVTTMRKMFLNAFNFNENLNHWDVSNITNMAEIFQSASSFNGDITNWDVSSVTFFFRAFSNAISFNQDISNWDVSNVGSVESMFDNADAFNQPIGKWDVSNVGKFKRMLANMSVFNQSLGEWRFKPNANFSQFSSGTNNMSCQTYSSTILGWNFNNPDLENLVIGGFNAEYDSIAAMARDELIARGWTIIGTNIGGDCEAIAKIRCQDTVAVANDTLFAHLNISANSLIALENIVVEQPGPVTISAPEVELNAAFELNPGVELDILQAQGCP